jgi:FG-GAP repeat
MVKRSLSLRVLGAKFAGILLGLVFVLTGCGTSKTIETFEGRFEVTGLPTGIKADITVTGPNGFSEKVTETEVLQLPRGQYKVDAKDVTAGETTYFVAVFSGDIQSDGYIQSLLVSYEAEAHLNLTVRGLLTGTNPEMTLKGISVYGKAEGTEQRLTNAGDVADLRPGNYELHVAEVSSDFTYTPRVNVLNVTLEPGSSASATIDYMTKTELFAGLDGGNSVAVDGDTMVVASLKKVTGGNLGYALCYQNTYGTPDNCTGAVTILQKDTSGIWKSIKTLKSDDTKADMFGYALAISGDTVAVGAYKGQGPIMSNEGAVYIFQRNQGGMNNWGLVQKLTKVNSLFDPATGSSGFSGHSLGKTLALNGETLVVGDPAFTYDANGDGKLACGFNEAEDECGAGAVFVYRYNSSVNQWISETQLRPSDLVIVDPSRRYQASGFGSSVAITKDAIFVGAPRRNADAGAVYIFNRSNLAELQRLEGTKTQEVPFPYFGTSLAVNGDALVVSAPDGTSSTTAASVAYAFQRNSSSNLWQEAQKISLSNASSKQTLNDTGFGRALALKDGVLVVGAPSYSAYKDDTDLLNVGLVYLFTKQNDVWEFTRELVSENPATNQYFGSSLAFDGNKLVVGAPGYNEDAGAFYIFE